MHCSGPARLRIEYKVMAHEIIDWGGVGSGSGRGGEAAFSLSPDPLRLPRCQLQTMYINNVQQMAELSNNC